MQVLNQMFVDLSNVWELRYLKFWVSACVQNGGFELLGLAHDQDDR